MKIISRVEMSFFFGNKGGQSAKDQARNRREVRRKKYNQDPHSNIINNVFRYRVKWSFQAFSKESLFCEHDLW